MIDIMIVVMLLVALLILGCGIYIVVAALKEKGVDAYVVGEIVKSEDKVSIC